MKKYNIAIIGPTFSGNKGSAAMLISCIENLSKIIPVNNFFVFSYYPKDDKKINPYKCVKIFSATPLNLSIKLFPLALLFRILQILKLPSGVIKQIKEIQAILSSDIVIDIAGVSFVDGREKFLPFNILTILIPMLLGKSVVKYSQALGPFNNPLNNLAAKIFLPKLKMIFARGQDTYRNLQNLNMKNISLSADGSFSLKFSNDASIFAKQFKKKHSNFYHRKIVGISPSSVVDTYCQKKGASYKQIIVRFIQYLTIKKYNVLLIPYSIRPNASSIFNNDLPLCRDIYKSANTKRCLLIETDLPPLKLNALISTCHIFIASRFHSMVGSLSGGIPTLTCGWSHKYKEVMEFVSMEKYALTYHELNGKNLISKFNALEKNAGQIKRQLQRQLPSLKKLSLKQITFIKNLLEA
ncbi:hypothetical protein A2617_02375 [Candidatus Daviesbacteria bacterium RIFOXYD1_FULL_41_10]|uniref:Polysaccharide pyruvyl transferase domain-containing protein n=3 Tax=Bacteria candidate phyla TaxID=1783234 RepID=A0A0G0IR55_9BACT|nr:MAG: hypothetical protein US31_C0004G0073 [Berkelbacteria bacterium GW2011_GWA1_36_9]KKQ76611.1 MAG: hypothetical protein US98_C0031G0008 [Parcubacteria group bacterium GW2011_GWC1_38_6]KKS13451.1 MAG: hypothetical protein UU67_C0024G0008 [Candidatus Daviesbacteria bacterium GW2011_GWB1_41_5]OGE71391.1 MAG: hypothetical protein A2617_02375 [Candidatus Daviesbacteria bacterium RIFOXYD1_FULL_41_10]